MRRDPDGPGRLLVGPAWPLRFASATGHTQREALQVTRVRALPPSERRVATVEHAWAAACADLDLVDAVTAGDRLLHLGRTDRAALEAYARSFHGRGALAARRAVAFVCDWVESPRETYLRLLLVLAGLAEPEFNVALGSDRSFVGRADLAYLRYALIIEYTGATTRRWWRSGIATSTGWTNSGPPDGVTCG